MSTEYDPSTFSNPLHPSTDITSIGNYNILRLLPSGDYFCQDNFSNHFLLL